MHYNKCRVCENDTGNIMYKVKEMMFGTREEFDYFECSRCGCLQIKSVPVNLSEYYPKNYFSFHTVPSNTGMKKYLVNARNRYAIFRRGLIGRALYKKFPNMAVGCLFEVSANFDTRILDVGCGSGALLSELRDLGFRNLLGVDPFNEKAIETTNGVKVLNTALEDIPTHWDVVMFHHSFEHIPNPKETLLSVVKLLTVDGYCILRIPTVSSYAWRYYRTDWIQLDAPRHLFLFSVESINLLAKQVGMELWGITFDSNEFQFWGSEQCRKGIPMNDNSSYGINPDRSIFSKKDISNFRVKAQKLNLESQGDQAVFYLRKTPD